MVSRVYAGQEVLEVLLQDPEAMGQRIGSLVDAVVDLDRLERTVQRNDEVRWQRSQFSPVTRV